MITTQIEGLQYMIPHPVSTRSVIDWLLRVTVGKMEDDDGEPKPNDMINTISEAIMKAFDGNIPNDLTNDDLQESLVSLVNIIRTFIGYVDKTDDSRNEVQNELKMLNEATISATTKIKNNLKDTSQLTQELGKALLKGRYWVKEHGLNKTPFPIKYYFNDMIVYFKKLMTLDHSLVSCTYGKGCHHIAASVSHSGDCNKDGLTLLTEFFKELNNFVTLWDSIGINRGGEVLQTQKREAAALLKLNNNSSTATGTIYFQQLNQALTKLCNCKELVVKLHGSNAAVSDSKSYRDEIQKLITELNKSMDDIIGYPTPTNRSNKADPRYAADAAKRLIEATKKNVQIAIMRDIGSKLEEVYHTEAGGFSSSHNLQIHRLISQHEKEILAKTEFYKHHLDDLKTFCQWLHRMTQLYNKGLKGFVDSLIRHFEHIHQAICWIEGINHMLAQLKDIEKASVPITVGELKTTGLKDCCKLEEHKTLNKENTGKFDDADAFFTALNCRINNLLASYTFHLLPKGITLNDQQEHDDEIEKRRKLILDLRLLAFDRYTAQLWSDNKHVIKDWVVFNGGIVKKSDLVTLMTRISELTGVYYKSQQNNIASAHNANPRSRISNFQAICLLQKFSYEEPLKQLEESLKKLKGIQIKLKLVYDECNNKSSQINDILTSFCVSIDKFLEQDHGIYTLAQLLNVAMGPNIFSAVINTLELLKDAKTIANDEKKKLGFIEVITILDEGLQSDAKNRNSYKLEIIIERLEKFIATLRREYIFSYPNMATTHGSATMAQLVAQNADSLLCSNYNKHNNLHGVFKCSVCASVMAKIFIGTVPILYRHFATLYGMCHGENPLWRHDLISYSANGRLRHDYDYLSIAGYMCRNGWTVKGDPAIEKDGSYVELIEEQLHTNSLGSLLDIISPNKSKGKCLDNLFRICIEHFKEVRGNTTNLRLKKLEEDYYEKYPKKDGYVFYKPLPYVPKTVRETLFWLHEVDIQERFYKDLCEHIEQMCSVSSINISSKSILHILKLSITQSLEVLSSIENPAGQNPTYLYDLYCEEHYYDYGYTTVIPVFFHTFMEKLMAAFLQLNFLCVQCEFPAIEGGWSQCNLVAMGSMKNGAEISCICDQTAARASSVTVNNCGLPLSDFLYGEGDSQLRLPVSPVENNLYMAPSKMPNGFRLSIPKNDERAKPYFTGATLVEPLTWLVGGHGKGRWQHNVASSLYTVIYLRDLLRYFLCLTAGSPYSTGESMAFFYWLSRSWGEITKAGTPWGDPTILPNIEAEIEQFPGTFKPELLTEAVEQFAGLSERYKHGSQQAQHGSRAHVSDLRSLVGCKSQSSTSPSCAPYICPLTFDVYTHYDHQHARAYLSWILHFGPAIYTELQKLKESLGVHLSTCVTLQSSTQPKPPSIVQCNFVLQELYNLGLNFGDRKILNDGTTWNKHARVVSTSTHSMKGICPHLVTQLGVVLQTCNATAASPLHRLIEVIEQFLWSIRAPFAYSQFGLWALAVLFLCYVFVVPLDHFKIQSHYFNQVRFTMHPSLLLSHGARKVTDVSYFKM